MTKSGFMSKDFGGSSGGGSYTGIPELFIPHGDTRVILLSDPDDLRPLDEHVVPPIETFFQYHIGSDFKTNWAYEEGDPVFNGENEDGYNPEWDPTADNKSERGVAYVFNLTAYEAVHLGITKTEQHRSYVAENSFLMRDGVKENFTGVMRMEFNVMVGKALNFEIANLRDELEEEDQDKFSLRHYLVKVRKTGEGKKGTSYSVFNYGTWDDLDEELQDHIIAAARPVDDDGKPGMLPDLGEYHIHRKKYGYKTLRARKREQSENSESSNGRPRRAGRTLVNDGDKQESKRSKRGGDDYDWERS